MRKARCSWREAAVGRRSALSCTRCHALHAARRPRAAMQRRDAHGAMLQAWRPRAATQPRAAHVAVLRGGVARGGCGPPGGTELIQARRSARSAAAKGRDAAASCASRHTPRWSGARRLWAAGQHTELHQARRSARSEAAKGRDAAARCARRDAPSAAVKGREAAASCARRHTPRWSGSRRLWATGRH